MIRVKEREIFAQLWEDLRVAGGGELQREGYEWASYTHTHIHTILLL
jgi:hypothetical protein